jgi:hypothetical protein
MIKAVQDILSRLQYTEGTEVEIRFPVPQRLFDGLHAGFMHGRDAQHSVSELRYSSTTDLRRVDGNWERKRVSRYERLPSPVPCRLCVCVESPCAPAAVGKLFRTVLRRRWTYVMGSWRVEWTQSRRSCNVEVEYTGRLDALLCAAREDDGLHGLAAPLHLVMASLACLAYGQGRKARQLTFPKHLPFAPYVGTTPPLTAAAHALYMRYMAMGQPVSLIDQPLSASQLVSVKYDGIRLVLVVQEHLGLSAAWGLCRREGLWSVPCLHVPCTMVLDCELMLKSRRIIAFDIYAHDGQPCAGSYVDRLAKLAEVQLPDFMGYSIERKAFYPASVVCPQWYRENAGDDADGLIFHDSTARLGQKCCMYKWKPVHTVDLLVGVGGHMVDNLHRIFLPRRRSQGLRLLKGEIWECAIDDDHVRPLRLRTDKKRANARHVCNDVAQAHAKAWTLESLATLFETRKRKSI